MRIALISFTENGFHMEKILAGILEKEGYAVCPWVLGRYAARAAREFPEFLPVPEGGLGEWAKERFLDSDALVFTGACGIAVRAVSPFVKDKRTDPAVLVLDEAGRFVIPVLSGHLGGANRLAELLVSGLRREGFSSQAVLTTATDVNRRFAVDVFAREHGLFLDQMKLAREISADILAGEPVGLFSDFPFDGAVPQGLFKDRICRRNLRITVWKKETGKNGEPEFLRLAPRCVVLGLGCRRGTPAKKLETVIRTALEEKRLDPASVCRLASIDLKSGEPGILELAQTLCIPFVTYTKERLEEIPGEFTESEFVKRTTGVGSVCERAAAAACMEAGGNARILIKKYARDGVTVAAACFFPKLSWEEGNKRL